MRLLFCCFVLCFSFALDAHPRRVVISTPESRLISHVRRSIENGEKEISRLSEKVLKIEGMSSRKVRHFLNNLCSLPGARYLEIGSWKGSTWVAALYKNEAGLSAAAAIDNWSEFGGPVEIFYENCHRFLTGTNYDIYSMDCFVIDPTTLFSEPVNLYFYDGNHSVLSQEMAFTYYNDILDDLFVAVVDDWNFEEVREGTRKAFEHLHYNVLFEQILESGGNDTKKWWNGLYVAVVQKTQR